MELDNLPVIDCELGTKLAGNKKELADELLGLFIKNVAEEISSIKQIYSESDFPELLRRIHKLHGAVCYCGLPRLKTVLAKLETDLKSNIMSSLPSLLNQLDIEVKLLLEHYTRQYRCSSGQVS